MGTGVYMHARILVFLVLSFVFSFAFAAAQPAPRDVSLQARDGVALKATYYAAPKPGPGILLLHMCNSDRKAWNTLAAKLATAGFHVVALDYRGYGESGGERSQDPQQQQATINQKWPGDVDAAFSYLVAQPGVDGKRIGAAGASCGVNQSVQLAIRHPEVRTLALLSGNTNSRGREYLRRATWLPLFAAASEDDGDALPYFRWLLTLSDSPNRLMEFQAAGHGTDMFAVEKGLEPQIVLWFEDHLKRAPAALPSRTATTTKPKQPNPVRDFWDALVQPDGVARAVEMYREAKKRDPQVFFFPETEMNAVGYEKLQGGDAQEAVELFKLNVEAYPNSANVYDSLADGYVAAGNRELAIQYSEKALETLRTNPPANAQYADAVRQSAEQKLRNLRGSSPTGAAGAAAPPPFEELFRMPVVYSVPGMDAAQVREDVVYKTVERPDGKLELKMDVYLPMGARPGQRHPVVVFISGGGVENPDWRKAGVYTAYGRLAAAQGFVGVSFQKRYARGPESLATGRDDTADLIRFLREHAAEYSLDPDRFAVWAFSAGGMMLGPPLADRPPYLRAVLNFYGVSDALPTMPEETQRAVRSGGFSAVESVKKEGPLPALFVGRAGLDNAPLNATIDAFIQEALRHNANIEVMNHPNGRHGFDILDPDARSREIIARAFEFLKAHLATAP